MGEYQTVFERLRHLWKTVRRFISDEKILNLFLYFVVIVIVWQTIHNTNAMYIYCSVTNARYCSEIGDKTVALPRLQ